MSAGRRVIVVGASSGLGRSIGLGLAQRGARVALLARREDRVATAAAEAGGGAVGIRCDVTDDAGCRRAVAEAADALGGVDGLVYATGRFHVAPLEDVDATTWADLFATNVTGAALVTAAALPHLVATTGTAVYLSSISASLTPPWPGIGSYLTTKAALDKLVEAWRAEHPEVGFTRIAVGDCAGGEGHARTEFLEGVDPDLAATSIEGWLRRGYMTGHVLDVADLVAVVDAALGLGPSGGMPTVTLAPRGPLLDLGAP